MLRSCWLVVSASQPSGSLRMRIFTRDSLLPRSICHLGIAINRLCNWRATFAKIPASNCCQSDQGFSSPAALFQVVLQRVLMSPSLPRNLGDLKRKIQRYPWQSPELYTIYASLIAIWFSVVIYKIKICVQVKSIIISTGSCLEDCLIY